MKTTIPTSQEPRRILVPLDFSDSSREALRVASQLSKRFGSHLALLHVTRHNRPDSRTSAQSAGTASAATRAGRAALAEFIKGEVPGGIRPARFVVDGVPFNEIATAARDWTADLIVIATHGYTGFKHAVLGSTAERVVRHAPCPVLVVRRRENLGRKLSFSPDRVRSILVPVDFSKSSLDALRYALALATGFKARLVLLHVAAPFHADMFMDTTDLQRAARVAARKRLTKLANATKKDWPRTGSRFRVGQPDTTITALAGRSNADLIVIGTHGHTGLKRALLGSVAERVVRHAPCPVLTVRTKGK